MKPRLIERGRIPYGGGFYIDRPDLRVVGKGLQFSNLLESVRAYRKANGFPVGLGFEDEVEEAACLTYPKECDCVSRTINLNRRLGIADIVRGTKVMLAQKTSGVPLVSEEKAEKHAAICAKCPFNQPFTKPCGGICAELESIVKFIIGSHGTTKDAILNSCAICGCFLRAAVWVDNAIQWPVLSDLQKEQFLSVSHCWKRPPVGG